MTTKLLKTVTRECTRFKDAGRDVLVSLEPGDVLSFRVKGLRARPYRVSLEGVYQQAAKAEARGK